MAVMGGFALATSVGFQYDASKEAAEAQEKQSKTQQRIADIRAQRERTSSVRRARIATAEFRAREAAGGVTTTGAAGAIATIGTQTAGAISTAQQVGQLSQEASIFNIEAARRSGKASGTADIFKAASFVASPFG